MSGFELDFVDWLRTAGEPDSPVPASPAAGLAGIGDDMAVIDTPHGRGLMSSDMLLDGVHFDSTTQSIGRIGRKAVACCLSDCAAMAVRPVAMTLSVAFPKAFALEDAKRLMEGARAIAREFDAAIVGGDTTRWDHPLAIDVAVLARPFEGIEPVTRGGAGRGDALYVTGPLGGSRLGRHLTFTPRVREARVLAGRLGSRLHAMIDISDGLSLDLWRLCRASGVGANVSIEKLGAAISEDALTVARADGRSALEHALNDGEDFELLMAVEGDVSIPDADLIRIGEITEGSVQLVDSSGQCRSLHPRGYVH